MSDKPLVDFERAIDEWIVPAYHKVAPPEPPPPPPPTRWQRFRVWLANLKFLSLEQ